LAGSPNAACRRSAERGGCLTKQGELIALENLKGFQVASDDPDPRGWSVISCDADAVGVVRTLLIDTALMKARYLVCDLQQPPVHTVVLPVTYARLDPEHKHVIFDLTSTVTFGQLPAYTDVPPSKEIEDQIHQLVAGTKPPEPPAGQSMDRRRSDRRE
jgi:photosynthetic reaction center H subunit